MTILIFSCNRALQLQTLLSSLFSCLSVQGRFSIQVVYAASDAQFELGYQKIRKKYSDVRFYREGQQRTWTWPRPTGYWKNLARYARHSRLRKVSNFKALTEQLIADSPHEGVMFLTDDSLFVRPVELDAARLHTVLADQAGAQTMSLRHGLTWRPIPPDVRSSQAGGYVWTVQTSQADLGHWTWRFSVDGHIYPRRFLLPILHRLHYANPNSLEGFVNEYIRTTRPDLFRTLLFNAEPSLVGFILNKVQTYNTNRSFDMAPAYLNDKLLEGFELAYVYDTPRTAFQPTLTAISLINPLTHERLHLPVTT